MSWDDATLIAVWEKGTVIPNFDPDVWRRDAFGANMKFSEHGNRDSEYGWEVDDIQRVADGGSDDLTNLRPLSWKSNAARQ
ncbi:MAG: HNH endonuclease [Nitrosopumilaceae archaeon]|nr:HNH endonuclease [Nitrosopumilaceae archaeon]